MVGLLRLEHLAAIEADFRSGKILPHQRKPIVERIYRSCLESITSRTPEEIEAVASFERRQGYTRRANTLLAHPAYNRNRFISAVYAMACDELASAHEEGMDTAFLHERTEFIIIEGFRSGLLREKDTPEELLAYLDARAAEELFLAAETNLLPWYNRLFWAAKRAGNEQVVQRALRASLTNRANTVLHCLARDIDLDERKATDLLAAAITEGVLTTDAVYPVVQAYDTQYEKDEAQRKRATALLLAAYMRPRD